MKRRFALATLFFSAIFAVWSSPAIAGVSPRLPSSPNRPSIFNPTTINRTATGGRPSGVHGVGTRTELPQLRTRTSRTFSTGGHYQAVLYPGSVNYQDAVGSWQPISNKLVPSRRSGFVSNEANQYRADIPGSFDQGNVRVTAGADWLELSISGAHGTSSVRDATATFVSALPG